MKSASYHQETALQNQSSILVAGIDEVGRGAMAGPLVAAAIVLPIYFDVELYDSKSINVHKREELAADIRAKADYIGLGWVTNIEIDERGLAWALKTAYLRSLSDIDITRIDQMILDGNVNYLSEIQACETMVGADGKIACVSAASIVAKVARDEYMRAQSAIYPVYGYETNVGYGTVSHREAIEKYGLSSLHRQSFCNKYI